MIKGLVIEKDYEKAENLKILLENFNRKVNVKIDMITEDDDNYKLLDVHDYEFILTHVKSINEDELRWEILPYIRIAHCEAKDFIKIRFDKRVIFIDRNEVVGVEVLGKECYIQTRRDSYKVGRVTMGRLLKALDSPYIVRCHRSFAINLKYVRGFIRETRSRWVPMFIIDKDFGCRVGQVYAESVFDRFSELYNVEVTKYIETV